MHEGSLDANSRSTTIRRQRFVATLRGLLLLVLVSIPTPLLGLVNRDTFGIAVGMTGVLAGVGAGYALGLAAARRGHWEVAEGITNAIWTAFPASLLLFFSAEHDVTIQALVITLGTLSIGVVQSVMLALGTWRRSRLWLVTSFVLFAVTLVWVLLREGIAWVYVVSLLVVVLLLGAANLWPVRTMFRDLEEALESSEAANVAKTRFLGNMSHELRTPLNAILGYVELLREEPERTMSDADRDLARVHSAGVHLLGLIDGILDLTRIEANRETTTFALVDVRELLEESLDAVRPMAARSGLELRLEVEDVGEVETDRQKIRQILVNLLGNALKYTDEGTVVVRARATDQQVSIEVEDSGVGIEPEDLQRIFAPFERTAADITRRVGGTGLGLAVSERLARLVGARLEGRSMPGVGSVFSLTLPRRAMARAAS